MAPSLLTVMFDGRRMMTSREELYGVIKRSTSKAELLYAEARMKHDGDSEWTYIRVGLYVCFSGYQITE